MNHTNELPAQAASLFYLSGPYPADGSYSVCELATGRILLKFGADGSLAPGAERFNFEAWFRNKFASSLYCESRWDGWQARAALAAQPVAQAQEPIAWVDLRRPAADALIWNEPACESIGFEPPALASLWLARHTRVPPNWIPLVLLIEPIAAAPTPEAACANTPYDEGPFTIAEASKPVQAEAPNDPMRVACITLDGTTLYIPAKSITDFGIGEDDGETYTLTFKTMTRAEFDALGEFDGF